MNNSIMDFTPFMPSDKALDASTLPDDASNLNILSARLAGHLSPLTLETIEESMRVINSYYSNLIEGNATRPHEIRAAQRGEYSEDPAKRNLQQESLGHMAVQKWIREQNPDLDRVFSVDFIKAVHEQFYVNIPEKLWEIKNEKDEVITIVEPGAWRDRDVEIGRHVPPIAGSISGLMLGFCDTYNPNKYRGDRKLIAIMAAHHRFSWIHPFMDGNGRVGRLLTDAALRAAGLDSCGAWCLSRALARGTEYKARLANADQVRQGDRDGRGQLTEKGLVEFCSYMLAAATDQVSFMGEKLALIGLRKRIDSYIQARNDLRVSGMDKPLNSAAAQVLHTAFIYGELERSQALELCAMPERSARRLLSQLKKEGLLSETSSKSPLRWEIPEHVEPWYFPDLAPQI